MPNHCENDLEIRGNPETLRAFADFARLPEGETTGEHPGLLSAHRFIPYPEEYSCDRFECTKCGHQFTATRGDGFLSPKCPECQGYAKDGYNRGGYEWCIEHWGTKWGMYDGQLVLDDFDGGHLSYTFCTAWSPPEPVIKAMSARFPSLLFELEYYEGGAGYQGGATYQGGEASEEHSSDYHGDRGG